MSRLLQFCCAAIVVIVALLHSAEAITAAERDNFLELHNNYRLKHHAPKLKYSTNLQYYAQVLVNQCKMVHSNRAFGENLAWGYKTINDATDAWYNEVQNYDYSKPGYGVTTGHFTQVVWKETEEVGCATRVCKDATMYACCYKQPGNIVGYNGTYFKDNVLPP
jgi:uncharacterized protein YkwD